MPYVIAVVAVVAAVGVRWLLDPVLGDRAPLLIVTVAVVLASVTGGLWPGLLATLLGTLSAVFLFMDPRFAMDIREGDVTATLLLYVSLAILISAVGEFYVRDRKRLEARTGEFDAAAERLRSANETFYNLVRNAPFGVYVVDSDFRVWQTSKGADKVFSSFQPVIGRDFDQVMRALWPEPSASEFSLRFAGR